MKVKEIENPWSFSYEIWEYTTVNNVPAWFPYNVFTELMYFFMEWWIIPQFDDNRNVITNVYSSFIFIEYSDTTIRQIDIKNNERINIINPIKSEVIDGSRQIGRNIGEFEYKGKYYLVVYPYNVLTDETNSEKWIFRWVIIDSGKYFKVQDETQNVAWKVDWIL